MSDANAQQDPSMEEILASIRRIISEDGSEGESEAEPESDEEILDLIDELDEEPAMAEAADPEPQPEQAFEMDNDPEPEAPAEVEMRDAAPSSRVAELNEALISRPTADSAENTFASLAAAVGQTHGDLPLGMGARTLEDLVKEVMRPMIKEWLDANLPGMVERMVGREIDRLSRRAEDR